jgi:hypothetical protein
MVGGLAECQLLRGRGEVMVSLNFASWNRVVRWLRAVEELKRAA